MAPRAEHMKILILHLSDIHVRTGAEDILNRAERIVDAVRGVDHPFAACVIALSGDIAFAGLDSQYDAAARWVIELRDRLREAFGASTPVVVAAIPGNHDCDLTSASPARANLIGSMAKTPALVEDAATWTLCAAVQDAFFRFLDRVSAEFRSSSSSRLYYEYAIPVNGKNLLVRCINTAWVSLVPEPPGQMAYPPRQIPDLPDTGLPVITMLHHPTNWMEPMTGRAVRQRLQQGPGIVLMGHEHIAGARNQRDELGGSTYFIDSPALQGHHHGDGSAFHAIELDTDTSALRVLHFRWEDERYSRVPGLMSEWTELGKGASRAARRFPLKATTVEWLQDPEVDLQAPSRGRLSLDDIFVYLDLQPVEQSPSSGTPRPRSSRLLLEDAAKAERVLVTGAREAGKTCLAKRVFDDSIDAGLVPIFIDAAKTTLSGDGPRLARDLGNRFEELYEADREDLWKVPREDRVLVLDNYHSLPLGTAAHTLALLSQRFGRVLLFSDDFAQHVQDLVSAAARQGGAPEVLHLRLLECGHQRREEMIEKFVQLARPGDIAGADALRDEMRKLLRIALGRYFAPAVPVAIVSLLQARAFRQTLDLSQSTYGYYYELLIKRSLAKNSVLQGEYDVMLAYLTYLADKLHLEDRETWDEQWMLATHQSFIADRGLRVSFAEVIPTLIDRGIIVRRADGDYEFRYAYYYYYFVARALAEALSGGDGAERVALLVTKLDDEKAANTLLFLTHLTKHAAVIDPLLAEAENVFSEVEPATLNAGSVPLEEALAAIGNLVYHERPANESRRELFALLDEVPEERPRSLPGSTGEGVGHSRIEPVSRELSGVPEIAASPEEDRAARDAELAGFHNYIERMYSAFRTLQILGQLLKNFPGSLNAVQKERITRAAYGVGLRLLASLHGLIKSNTEDIVREIVDNIRMNHPELANDRLQMRAMDELAWYVFASSYGVVQRIAANVGTPHLTPIFERIAAEDPTAAIKLVTIALELDRAGGLSIERVEGVYRELAKNPLAQRVLRGLVLTHLQIFDLPRDVKQRVCAKIDIDYKAVGPSVDPRLKMLGA